MRTKFDREQINTALGRAGLATLDDPQGMLQQLGFLVEDHAHFRRMLIKCQPESRREMYESLRPHLSFNAKPLDVYISEGAAEAEARQLPTIGADGQLHAYQVPDVRSMVQEIAGEFVAEEFLTLTCRKCTFTEIFSGQRKCDAVAKARDEGWVYDCLGDLEFAICPDCPAVRN